MKVKLVTLLLLVLVAVPILAKPPAAVSTRKAPRTAASSDYSHYIDVNNILMFVTNDGQFGRDLAGVFGYDYGTFFPYNGIQYIEDGSGKASPLYASGLWVGGIDSASGEIRVKVAEYNSEYCPGPVDVANATFFPDRPEFKLYHLYSDSLAGNPNDDYTNWIVAARQGAPFVQRYDTVIVGFDTTITPIPATLADSSTPAMIGDQMTWAVFNDLNLDNQNDAGHTNALGIEIRQTTFAFKREGPLNNIIFVKFQVFNKTDRVIQNAFFSLWADPDLGGSSDDLVGCDTTLSLGFIYNANNNDQEYHSRPPCLGYDFFQGPLVYTGDTINDIGKAWGRPWKGYKNLGMSSFNKYINGTDPADFHETYNYMQGLNADGSPLSNGTTYQVPGDPVLGTGDLDVAPADRRFQQTTGPITFRPGDSTEILAAIIVGQGGDRLSSISVMKYFDVTAQDAYNNDFKVPEAPAAPRVTVSDLDGQISLRWTDTSEVDPGDYPFQGYTVYQGPASSGPWTQIANYDLIDGQSNITDLVLDPNTGILETRAVKVATDNGIRHYFGVTKDYLTGGNINNLTRYFFRVEAYSFDGSKSPKTLTSATNLTSVPQPPIAQVDVPHRFGDTIPVTHVGGISDGSVLTYVVDPKALTGDTYRVTFFTYPDTTIIPEAEVDTTRWFTYDTLTNICFITFEHDTLYCVDTTLDSMTFDTLRPPFDTTITDVSAWRLRDVTKDTLVLDSQVNQSGDDNYRIVDGLLVKVMGPPPGLKTVSPSNNTSCDPTNTSLGWCIPSGTRRFTWAGGADGLHFENFLGALGWSSVYAFFGGPQGVPASDLKNVQLRLATTDTLGVFDPNDANVSYAYRFGRGFAGPPALPEFGPFIVNPSGGYSYQDFTKSVPLSAWDVDANPPRRLALGFLENNAPGGTVDGKYWPPLNTAASNTDGAGPREWLFIYNTDYTTTADPALEVTASTNSLPQMYFATWARRAQVGWATGDEFNIYTNHINLEVDTFNFVAAAPLTAASGENRLDQINTVPNPYYLFGPYDPTPGNRTIKFQHLPGACSIKIFNLGGDLVRTLQKDDATSSILEWDVLTDNLLPLASGIYIWVVEAPGYGTKTGKMAIFNQTEVLQKY